MASEIISNTIDANFPVAGQDNDSQGFRDNFNIIKTALSVANTEITDLQSGAARVDAGSVIHFWIIASQPMLWG